MLLAKKKATEALSFGYHRAEILGAMASVFLIIVLTGVLVYTAILRILSPPERFNADFMLYTAIFGLVCNLVMVKVLHDSGHAHGPGSSCGHDHGDAGHDHGHGAGGHDHAHDHAHDHGDGGHDHAHDHGPGGHDHAHDHAHDHGPGGHDHAHDHGTEADNKKNLSKTDANENANIRAAFIHILGDILQSVGVVMAAIVIKIRPDWHIIDPICTLVFAVIVTCTTYSVLTSCVSLLMESTPEDLDMIEFTEDLNAVEGVEDIHDLHVWSLTHGKPSMTAHIRGTNPDNILRKATLVCRKYGIYHSTIQVEKFEQSVRGGKYFIDCGHNVH